MSKLRERGTNFREEEKIEARAGINQAADNALSVMGNDAFRRGIRGFDGDGFEGLNIEELRNLGLALVDAPNIDAAYTLMAGTSLLGHVFYDKIIAPQHKRALRVLQTFMQSKEPEKVSLGVDIGAGTGESTLVLTNFCKKVIAVEPVRAMARVADKKLKKRNLPYEVRLQDTTTLDLPENSIDILIDNGIVAYLDQKEYGEYWQKIHNVLKQGGRYYTYFAEPPEDLDIYRTSARAELVGDIVAVLFSHSILNQHKKQKPALSYGPDLGFNEKIFRIADGPYEEYVLQWTKAA